ncbi:MAG: MBL fold metallo-hydrolase [Verrucomicrobiae bacterium]|nr:MBL fold metallo-hydrolase [Verrucomicrobiae bacterium]
MKLHFFGACRTTTGSKYLLEINGHRLLLECGMFQGRRRKTIEYNSALPFDAATVDAVLLSHAHIDHSGLLPVLTRQGFHGPIYATEATVDLARVMLLDSAQIQEQDAAFVSKKHLKRGLPPVSPLYTIADAERTLRQLQPVAYGHAIEVAEGVHARWLDAGHILGSAMIILDLEESGRRLRLAFSGDIGRGRNNILRDPEHPRDVDVLLIESTYGNRNHEPLEDVQERLCQMIQRAHAERGKIIIPAFAVDRTQQLLYVLHQLVESRCIPALPVFVDSPMAREATAVFQRHPECFNPSFAHAMREGKNPFSGDHLTFIGSVEESMALNDHDGPAIIISASGMAEAGRIRHHIKNNIGDPRNLILIVGWCAPHTLGSHLASGHSTVTIFGEEYRVRARVETINAFSGHADSTELRAWAGGITGTLRNIYVVHGELPASEALAESLRTLYPQAVVNVPSFGDAVELPAT